MVQPAETDSQEYYTKPTVQSLLECQNAPLNPERLKP